MKIFYDWEMVERGPAIPIQPLSIGMVRDDGEEFYGINAEALSNAMKHPWVSTTAVPFLPIRTDGPFISEWDKDHPDYQYVMNLDQLAEEVRRFITEVPGSVELWADYGAYDHVCLCQLWGSMADKPAGIPMFTHDIQQLAELNPHVSLPPTPDNNHHALYDARWARDAYNALTTLPRSVGLIGAPGAGVTELAHGVLVDAPVREPVRVRQVDADVFIDIGWGDVVDVVDAEVIEDDQRGSENR